MKAKMADTESVREVTYEEMVQRHPEFKGVISPKSWDYVRSSDKRTCKFLTQYWKKNIEKNFKYGLWEKHGPIKRDCFGWGRGKATVCVGAGPSLKKNIHVLKRLADMDGVRNFEDRNFIIMSSNHQFKPLLRMGIIPDFVVLTDASDVVYKQLCEDIPENGKHTILLATPQASPRVLKKWHKQGRMMRFYLTQNNDGWEAVKRLTGENPSKYAILQGGNVMNCAWALAMMVFQSRVFMALGNDLSFPIKDNIVERRASYYADGDYSTNAAVTGTGRDEAKSEKKWMGFKLHRPAILLPGTRSKYSIEIEPVHTTGTLWVYKTWLEANVMGGVNNNFSYHYYNCTEGGIAGVMCKDDSDEGIDNPDNWFMLDEACKRYHTRMFVDAIDEFFEAKERFQWEQRRGTRIVAPDAGALVVAA